VFCGYFTHEGVITVRRAWNSCIDCKEKSDWYMVTDRVWEAAGLPEDEYCCLGCLECRLRRPLMIDDFTTAPVNRLAWAAAGKLSIALEHERRGQQQWDQLEIFLWGRKRRGRWLPEISPATVMVSCTGTVHIVHDLIHGGRMKSICGFTLRTDEGIFEPIRQCVFCWQATGLEDVSKTVSADPPCGQ
jgi:hypothetical protein